MACYKEITVYTNIVCGFYSSFRPSVSEQASVGQRQFSNFSAISWSERVNFQWDDDEVRFVLDLHTEFDFL